MTQLRPDRSHDPADSAGTRESALDRFFRITERGSTVSRELRGGLTTFIAMCYIVLLNPLILGAAADITGAKLSIEAITTATALAAAVTTVMMGVVGNAPLALASGLGINAIVAFQLAPAMTWAQAFGLVALEGICIILMAVSGVRERIINAIPMALKTAITVGLGLYIALIGMVNAGFVTRTPDSANSDVPVRMGTNGHLVGWPIAIFCIVLLLMIVLVTRKVTGAILISIVAGTVLAIVVNSVFDVDGWGMIVPTVPEQIVGSPDFSLLGRIDLFGAFFTAGPITASVFLFTLVLSGFFDAMGTITSVSDEAGLMRNGKVEGMGRILFVDGTGALIGGVTGSSPNTVFLESATGVGEGARTGLASVVTGGLFTAVLFFTPLVSVVPAQAAAPALVVVGAMMMAQCARIPWNDMDYVIPVFLTVTLIPYTYSITNGVGAGIVSYALIKVCKGKFSEVGWLVGVLAVIFLAYFGIEGITALL